MKRKGVALIALMLSLSLTGCGSTSADSAAEADAEEKGGDTLKTEESETEASATNATTEQHTIGVLVYNVGDEEVLAFREYLNTYITSCFDGVEFLYSDTITSEEEELNFIQEAADAGVEGIMSFNSYDLAEEVALCSENQVYYMMASGTVSDEAFASVEDDPYFLGVVGPGTETEYQAGADMAAYFAEQGNENSYFILSGGASMGNEMHLQRTEGILDTLQDEYGVEFETDTETLASAAEADVETAGDLTVCVCPGYLDYDEFLSAAEEAYNAGTYQTVMSVLPLSEMANTVNADEVGLVDCYTVRNLQLFNDGKISYVTGKYSSIIGPSFAAMYNAVCGYADDFREDGKAFQVSQGFWTSAGKEDFDEKYSLASSVTVNAYNYEDLQNVCRVFNPDATLDDLKTLAEQYTYEEAAARRGL